MRVIDSYKHYILLLCIFLIALFLRIYHLSEVPVGLHGDEASFGYNAYSLLKTAHDQNGNFLPLAIDQFGDFRPAGYHYLAIPFVLLFGLNELSVRLPGALFGAATVLLFYFFLLELFERKTIAFLGSFLLAILPWHINISRASSEGVVAAFFIILGTYLYLRFLNSHKKDILLLLFSFLSFVLSFFFYHSARFFVPVFLLLLIFLSVSRYKVTGNTLLRSLGFFAILIITFAVFFKIGSGTNRPLDVSIFNIPGGTSDVKHQQDEDGTQNPLLTRFYHNKAYFYEKVFLDSYFEHFDGKFLFVNTGFPVRYRVPWTGNMYLVMLPFLVFGFAVLLSEGIRNRKYYYLIPIAWLFIAAVPAGLTYEDIPNIQRSSLMIYGLITIAVFGFYEALLLLEKGLRTITIGATAIVLMASAIIFFHNYFYHSKIDEPWHRSAAEAELIFTVDDYVKKNKKIIMTTESNNNFIFYLFYNKFDPAEFQRRGSPKEKENLVFDTIKYTYHPCPLEGNPKKSTSAKEGLIYVNKPNCKLPKNAEILHEIRTPDGLPAFFILRLKDVDEATIYRESQIQ